MCLHSAELNVVAVTENVNTFLLVWTHVSRYGVNWLYFCQVYKVLTVGMCSSQLSNYELLFLHLTLFIYRLIFYLKPPDVVRQHWLGNTFATFFFFPHWVYGFSYEAAQVNSLAWIYLGIFPYHSLLMMLNSVCYLDGNKHWGSQFELQTHSRLLVVNINRIKTRSLFKHGNLLRHV